jgi:signal transduction histidine kinase
VFGRRIIVALERRIPARLRVDLDTRRRSVLALCFATAIAALCVPLAAVVFVAASPDDRLLGVSNTLLTAGLVCLTGPLLRRGGLEWAASWLAGLLFVGASFSLYSSGAGVFSPFVLIFPLLAALATIIGGRASGVVWTIVCAAAIAVFAGLGPPAGLEPTLARLLRVEDPTLMAATTEITILLLITGFVAFSETSKREAIVQIAETTRRLDILIQEEQRARDVAAEAVAANAAKSAFLATMSHELRTPLNIILGYSELVLEHLEERGDPDTAEDVRRVHGAGLHLLGLISDVLDLSKIEAARLDLSREAFDLEAMLNEMALGLRPHADRNGTALHVDAPPGMVLTGLDRTRVRQILLNLASNAIKFTPAGKRGEVHVRARRAEGAVEISVQDNGIGIPADKLELIFLPFTQVDPSTTRRYEGTGLGLAISRRLCELMGGTLTVTSAPGRGSSFTDRLPCT